MHPFQNTYFNIFAGNNLKEHWDVDYWGLSNRQALNCILRAENKAPIRIWSPIGTPPIIESFPTVPQNERWRLVEASKEDDADYIITNYRCMIDNCYRPRSNMSKLCDIGNGYETIASVFSNEIRRSK